VSGRIVGEILDNAPADLTPAELLVLVAIGEDARDRDRIAQYSDLESLVRRTRLKPGTVRNALSSLARRALIRPLKDRVHRGGNHQEYAVERLTHAHRTALHVVSGE
jgi:DNA-binding MarR family transcriptional regulator